GVAVYLAVAHRIEGPEFFAGRGIQGIDAAGSAGSVQHAVDHDGRGFLPARRAHLVVPRDAKFGDVARVDLVERRVVTFAEVAAFGEPLARFAVGIQQAVEGNIAEARWPEARATRRGGAGLRGGRRSNGSSL